MTKLETVSMSEFQKLPGGAKVLIDVETVEHVSQVPRM